MIGSDHPSHQRFPAAGLLLLAGLGFVGCSGGGGGSSNLPPTIVTAAFVGAGATPVAGDSLLLFFSEDVSLVAGAMLSDTDVTLSGNATLGVVSAAPTLVSARSVAIVLGTGVDLTPGATTIAFAATDDAVRDLAGALGTGGDPVVIGTSDGVSPTLTNVTIAAIQDELNGTGAAGGTLQVPSNGWTLDLTFSDNGAMDAARTQVTATVPVGTSAGTQAAGTNLLPFLTQISAGNTAASYRVPATTTFPDGAFTLACVVVDASGLASNTVTFAATARAFSAALQPFETTANSQQVWFLDFSRDIESLSTSAISGNPSDGVSVDATAGANGRSDFEDVLRIVGLNNPTPIPNVSGGQNSNQVAIARFQQLMLTALAELYDGANVTFTLTQPSGDFGTSSSVPYAQLGYSRISVAGSSTITGVLGIAIFDPSNATQNDDTLTDFQGNRLGVFLQTIADAGMGPPSSSQFRLTFGLLAPSLGGTAIGNDAQDGARLTGFLTDSRAGVIDTAIADLARFTAVIAAHECGHSMGLVRNGAMPTGLYGNDSTDFPGSTDGHIRTPALFPAGATNVMSPALSYTSAINPSSAFNRLNLAYLREQVLYGN